MCEMFFFSKIKSKFPLFIKDKTLIPKRTPTDEEPKTAGGMRSFELYLKGKGKPYGREDSKGTEKT